MNTKQLEAKYTLFEGLEEMQEPEKLSSLLSQPVTKVELQPMEDHGGLAGGKFRYVNTDAGRFVLKQMSSEFDWIMYITDDRQCRAVTLWQYGLLDELRPHLEHKIIACTRDGDGWGILMHDLGNRFFGGWERSIPGKLVPVFLDRLARLHAAFWNDPRLDDPRLGLCDMDIKFDIVTKALASTGNHHPLDTIPVWNDWISVWIKEGWAIMAEQLDKDLYLQLSRLRDNPKPLLKALERYPYTLLHGDYRDPNLAHLEPDQPAVIDWQQTTRSLMTIDLSWFTGQWQSYAWDAIGKTRLQNIYRERLENYLGRPFDDYTWSAMLDLGELTDATLWSCVPAYFSKHTDNPEERVILEKKVKQCIQQLRDGMRWL